jgi:hypothetical protein
MIGLAVQLFAMSARLLLTPCIWAMGNAKDQQPWLLHLHGMQPAIL